MYGKLGEWMRITSRVQFDLRTLIHCQFIFRNETILAHFYFETAKRRIYKSLSLECIQSQLECNHDDVIKRKHFPRYWPFMQ